MSDIVNYHLTVNGVDYPVNAAQGRNLLSVIRTEIGLTGTLNRWVMIPDKQATGPCTDWEWPANWPRSR